MITLLPCFSIFHAIFRGNWPRSWQQLTWLSVNESQYDVSCQTVSIIIFGLTAIHSSEDTVEHGELILLGLFLMTFG